MASLHAQFDGSSSSSVFSGSAFNPPPQSTQIPDPSSSPSKGRGSQGAIPLTVRQIAKAYASAEDKSNLTINGVDITSLSGYSGIDGARNDIYNMVLAVFQEPAVLAHEHGLHVDEVVKILGIPKNKILDALGYLVDVGHIYSTIDECHFKSACGD